MSGLGSPTGTVLPPLPKSLSNAKLSGQLDLTALSHIERDSTGIVSTRKNTGGRRRPAPSPPPPPAPKQAPPPPPPRKQTKLDVQLARLRKEMYKLRELDLSVLSQLWSLNEALQEFRSLQEMMSPSSDIEEDNGSPAPSYPPQHMSSSSSSSSNSPYITEL